ncbi:hypothetical protein A2U01_0086523 [Trifolium medium]|uniref:Uncharacterized protein n=1 Tax=Trifolium medium TaxID=97028 RepID=A0A392TZK6_9FABA|nr:hypothetical protein [Trifolium medium]
MASASHNHGDGDHDTVPLAPPHEYDTVLSPVANDRKNTGRQHWRSKRQS